jgi:hypothetical protein
MESIKPTKQPLDRLRVQVVAEQLASFLLIGLVVDTPDERDQMLHRALGGARGGLAVGRSYAQRGGWP